MRTTIDPLVRQVRAFCGKHDMLPQGGTVLCAVSGGRDSMALLHLLGVLGAEEGFQVAAAHFNHRLRPAADRDEAFVRSWCAGRGIPLFCGSGDVSAFARETGRSVEDAARELRYRFLEEAAEDLGADRIAAAHHREDNAETVLLHLLRGAALQGLGGIPPVRGRIVRPLLETAREDIDQYIRRHSIPFVEDETNSDTAFTRNRLRLEVLPVLEESAIRSILLRGPEGEDGTPALVTVFTTAKRSGDDGPVTWLQGSENITSNETVRALLEDLRTLSLTKCVDYDPSDEAASICGFDAPPAALTVNYASPTGTEESLTLTVGNTVLDGSGRYVRLDGSSTIYSLPTAALDPLMRVAVNGLDMTE